MQCARGISCVACIYWSYYGRSFGSSARISRRQLPALSWPGVAACSAFPRRAGHTCDSPWCCRHCCGDGPLAGRGEKKGMFIHSGLACNTLGHWWPLTTQNHLDGCNGGWVSGTLLARDEQLSYHRRRCRQGVNATIEPWLVAIVGIRHVVTVGGFVVWRLG